MKPIIVISSKAGELGNRLFNYTNFIAFAAEHKMTVFNPSFDEYAELFETTKNDLLCCFPSKRFFPKWIINPKLRRLLYKLISLLARIIKKLDVWKKIARVVTVSDRNLF